MPRNGDRTWSRLAFVALIELHCVNCAHAWSTDWSYTQHWLNNIQRAAEAYRATKRDWPRDTASQRWFEALEAENLISRFDESSEDEGWTGPKDRWGHLIIYLPPAIAAPPTTLPVIRSVGENGIDEQGSGDDLVAGGTINPGSYGRPTTAALQRFSLVSPLLLLLILWLLRKMVGRWHAAMLIATGLWIGASFLIASRLVWPYRFGRGFVPLSENLFSTGMAIIAATFVSAFVLLVIWLVKDNVRATQETVRIEKGLCTTCGYDLKGLPQHRCPECGHENTSPIPPVVLLNQFIPDSAAPPRSAPHQSDPA